MSTLESFVQLIGVLLIFLFVLVCTYFVTKWMAGFQQTQSRNRNLNVVETTRIGNNKMICLVQIGEKFIVVAVGKDEVTFLTEVSKDMLTDLSFEKIANGETREDPFKDILLKIKENLPKKQE
ncbi:flagellar protein FliO/FliZ [Lachnospiraceae bacterium C7]|nr:flagellar protein FliO/FliZ [Lachnospiraceae bacterium C7]